MTPFTTRPCRCLRHNHPSRNRSRNNRNTKGTDMNNAMQSAMNATVEAQSRTKDYFVECEIDTREVVFQQVDGRWQLVDYDANNPEHKNPDVEITFHFYGTTRDGATYSIDRTMQARSRKRPDWTKVVRPSLTALGITDPMTQVHKHWVHIELVKTGEYTNKEGEQKDLTTPRFVEVFESREACEAAAEAFWNERRNGGDTPTRNVPQPIMDEETEHPQRATLVTLLPAMWQAAQQQADPAKAFQQMLEANPLMKDAGITMTSNEVIDATGILPY
jgi:hypothetical protein